MVGIAHPAINERLQALGAAPVDPELRCCIPVYRSDPLAG